MTARADKRFLTGSDSAPAPTEIAKSLYKIPALLTTWTRCGKSRCRCGEGHLHGPYHALHWREGRVQRRRYVRSAEVSAVRAILEKRQEVRRREQLDHALALMTWRQMARQLEEIEARISEERERP